MYNHVLLDSLGRLEMTVNINFQIDDGIFGVKVV
jgi:hypothetical protein